VAAYVQQHYQGAPEAITFALEQFVNELAGDGLVVPRPAGAAPAGAPNLPAPAVPRAAFSAPVLQKYDDMQDLIMLDPIHEVDDSGWPARKPDAPAR
jgi:hypothetical protein